MNNFHVLREFVSLQRPVVARCCQCGVSLAVQLSYSSDHALKVGLLTQKGAWKLFQILFFATLGCSGVFGLEFLKAVYRQLAVVNLSSSNNAQWCTCHEAVAAAQKGLDEAFSVVGNAPP
jgi:hypothetical protein